MYEIVAHGTCHAGNKPTGGSLQLAIGQIYCSYYYTYQILF